MARSLFCSSVERDLVPRTTAGCATPLDEVRGVVGACHGWPCVVPLGSDIDTKCVVLRLSSGLRSVMM